MRRRSSTGRDAAEARRRKAATLKRRNAPKAVRHRSSSAAHQETKLARLLRERDEAQEQQAATADVFKVISRSTFDLQTVLNTLTESAARLCAADKGAIFQQDGDVLRLAANYGFSPEAEQYAAEHPAQPNRGSVTGRVVLEGKAIHVADVLADPEYGAFARGYQRVFGYRTYLGVPLLRDGTMIGSFSLTRDEVSPFTEKQIELATTFADQAVIAIENARLLNELRQRTADLTESLEQQTATANVLRIISSSTTDIQPVLDTIVRTAAELCASEYAALFRLQDGNYHAAAWNNAAAEWVKYYSNHTISVDRGSLVGRTALERNAVHIVDCLADPEYAMHEAARLGRQRSMLGVPLLNNGIAIGVIGLLRTVVKPFTDKQIELVTGFADQAVIAIENARLLNELRQRTTDLGQRTEELTELLEQQTATSEVLQVISRSTFDLQTVLDTLTESAVRLCSADNGVIFQRDGDLYRFSANFGFSTEAMRYAHEHPLRPSRTSLTGRVALDGRVHHIPDVLADPEYRLTEYQQVFGYRTNLGVPLLRAGSTIGIFSLTRKEVNPFTDKQIELVKTFADQAVIAIENARLLHELRQSTEEVQTLNQHLEQRVADQVGEIERMGRLRRFLPPQVADLIVASGTEKQLESHRREITALFCDLRGFTGFTESADAEDVMALLRDYHSAIGEIIIKYSGTLERYAGDGVMVIFNDPVPVENPALQAVLMALEMRDAIGALTEKWSRLGHEIGFGIGIAHGYATLGTCFEGRHDYAAIGTVSNVASRLCDEAKPGQILISPRVLMAVKDAVMVEAVGEFELKGIRRPTPAYNVLAALPPSP